MLTTAMLIIIWFYFHKLTMCLSKLRHNGEVIVRSVGLYAPGGQGALEPGYASKTLRGTPSMRGSKCSVAGANWSQMRK
eukprot:6203409-Pleurochrysis_carterae.AAC.4